MGYPRRETHFAHRFTRLLAHVCAAQEIGHDACYLLVIIVHCEDAKKYRDAVTYWNEQIQAIAGLSPAGLWRARKKAVESGWLHYEEGRKGQAARYWVTIPTRFQGLPDVKLGADIPLQYEEETGNLPLQSEEESGRNAGGIRRTFYPVPNPDPKTPCSPPRGDDQMFEEFWAEVPKKIGPKAALRAWRSAVRDVARLNGTTHQQAAAKMKSAMRTFAASPKAKGRFCPSPARWLREGRYDDDPATWQEGGDPEAAAADKAKRDEECRKRERAKQQAQFAMEKARAERDRAKLKTVKGNCDGSKK